MPIRTDKTITGVSYNGTSIPLVGAPTQTKSTTITSNGSSVVVPDTGYTLSQVSINVNVPGPSGSINITTNGTHDVANYASAVVNVPAPAPTLQSKTATDNGVIIADAGYDGLSSVTVNVPKAIPIEVSTDAGMTAVLTAENVGKAYKFTGTTGTYTNGDIYIVEA